MRRLMTALMLVVLLIPITGSAVNTGDPTDTNDGPAVIGTDPDSVEYHCANYDGVSSPFEDWACDVAMAQALDGWWDWPW